MTNAKFIQEFMNILGNDNFLLTDNLDQESLFEIQDRLAQLIVTGANNGLPAANIMVKQCPNAFNVK